MKKQIVEQGVESAYFSIMDTFLFSFMRNDFVIHLIESVAQTVKFSECTNFERDTKGLSVPQIRCFIK